MIQRALQWIRKKSVQVSIHILSRYGQAELLAVSREKAVELAIEFSVKGVQLILDQEGIAHCFACVKRFGLRFIDGKRVCEEHVKLLRKENQPAPVVA